MSSPSRMRLQVQLHETVVCVAWSPDGPNKQMIAAGLRGGRVYLLDAASGAVRTVLHGHTDSVDGVAFSPPAKGGQLQPPNNNSLVMLASASWDTTVRLWSISEDGSGECLRVLQSISPVFCVAFSPCGPNNNSLVMLALGPGDNTVRLWLRAGGRDAMPGPVLRGHRDTVLSVAFSADGAILASASVDGTARLWHMPDGAPGRVLQHAGRVNCVAFSPGSKLMLASGSWDGAARLWDVCSGEIAYMLREPVAKGAQIILAFSFDGTPLAATASNNNIVRLWRVASGKPPVPLRTLRGHQCYLNGVAFAPSGKQVASCSNDGTVRIWAICEWSDRTHRLFGPELKACVFQLMCVKQKLEQHAQHAQQAPLPMEMWLEIFGYLVIA